MSGSWGMPGTLSDISFFFPPFTLHTLLDNGKKPLVSIKGKYRIALHITNSIFFSSFFLLPLFFLFPGGFAGDRIQWDAAGGGNEFEGLIR